MGECTRGREGRAGEELDHRSKRGREQRENAPPVGKSARARCIIDRRGAGAASCRRETAARQRPLSSALRVSAAGAFLLLPTALLRPSAPPVCCFSPRISAPSAFLLLRNRLSSAVQPRCRFAIAPFSRLFFLIGRRERLCSAKNPCPPACAPRRYRARGATVFGFSLARFRLAAPFFC